jgi:hypothetical protein
MEIKMKAKDNPTIVARNKAVMIRVAGISYTMITARAVKVGPVRVKTVLFRKLNLDME